MGVVDWNFLQILKELKEMIPLFIHVCLKSLFLLIQDMCVIT